MVKFKHAYLVTCLLASSSLFAQTPKHESYVVEQKDIPFYQAYASWAPGSPLFSDAAEDEEFFISRVKPKERFTYSKTQVDPEMNSERKLLWWCPIGTQIGNWKSTPSYHFDSEVFSMWSYTDIYGNWTAPFIRMSGAFSDICHKNGVRTSVLASVPWAASISENDGGHGSNINALNQGGPDKLLEFLRYYGIDGIGFNSEFNMSAGLTSGLKTLLSESFSKRETAQWPTFTNAWYSLMTNGGSVGGGDALSSSNQDWFNYNGHPTSDAYFMNYDWGGGGLSGSETTAKSFGRSSFDVYGGMDFQGRNTANWTGLKTADISVGIWGAHDMNMIFESRSERGSEPLQKQKTYQLISENVFTGATYNPVNDLPIKNILRHNSTNTEFHGFSKFITARSVLASENLAEEPFVTYFNLGNGLFFNVNGERTFNNEWYNIGIQDYLPTWRWWFTTEFMGRDKSKVASNGLKAEFTWDDAWFGGSCLSVAGKTEEEYMHLFKTKYNLEQGDQLTIRYKLTGGSGSMTWACAAEGNDDILTAVTAPIVANASAGDEWVEKKVTISNLPGNNLKLAGQTMAIMGIKFTDTSSDFNVLIGEISLTSKNLSETPVKPTIVKADLKASNYRGVDFKLVFKMKDRVAGSADPIYNEDVKTWFYKIYIEQEGGQKVMCTATTSWASYVVAAPYDRTGSNKVRIGVSAVSLDGKSESDIAWSELLDIPVPTVVEGIEIDKPVIKLNETFTIKYTDPTHVAAEKWEILNAQTDAVVATMNDATSISTELDAVGIYDLRVTSESESELHQALIQISPEEVGAFPEINSLKANNSEEPISVGKSEDVVYSYTGRKADGYVSRGLRMSEVAFGVPCDQLQFTDNSKFTICYWFCPATFNHGSAGTHMLNIRSAAQRWPFSDWGYIWTSITPENKFEFNIRIGSGSGGAGSETKIPVDNFTFAPNQWYHMAVVIGYGNGREVSLYVNGKLIETKSGITDLYGWRQDNVIMVGGLAANRAGFDGYLDEFQLYNEALTAEEVKKSMEHQVVIPENLIGYWDFETDVNENNEIYSTGTNKTLKAYMAKINTVSQGENQYLPTTMTLGTGAPFISGSVYKIETLPSWNLQGGQIKGNITGTDESGNVTATYNQDGIYTTTLTLTNGWGSTSKTFNYVKVEGENSISKDELDAAYSAYPNPFENEVSVQFVNAGTYDIEVFDMAGRLINMQQTTVSDNENIIISVNGEAGVYFINIKQNGTILRALKVIKK